MRLLLKNRYGYMDMGIPPMYISGSDIIKCLEVLFQEGRDFCSIKVVRDRLHAKCLRILRNCWLLDKNRGSWWFLCCRRSRGTVLQTWRGLEG